MLSTWKLWTNKTEFHSRLKRLDRKGWYWIMTFILAVGILFTTMDVLNISFRNVSGTIGFSRNFPFIHTSFGVAPGPAVEGFVDMDQVAPGLRSKLPAGVDADSALPVTVKIETEDLKSKLLYRLTSVPLDLLAIIIIWLLKQMVLSAVGTDTSIANPFVRANVRRLRVIAAILLAMPVVAEWSKIAAFELLDKSVIKDMSVIQFDMTLLPLQLGVGVLLLILAEVFAAGIRLQGDVEGLV